LIFHVSSFKQCHVIFQGFTTNWASHRLFLRYLFITLVSELGAWFLSFSRTFSSLCRLWQRQNMNPRYRWIALIFVVSALVAFLIDVFYYRNYIGAVVAYGLNLAAVMMFYLPDPAVESDTRTLDTSLNV
jgi:hypothetical protein